MQCCMPCTGMCQSTIVRTGRMLHAMLHAMYRNLPSISAKKWLVESGILEEGRLLLAGDEPLLEHVLIVAVAPGPKSHDTAAEDSTGRVHIEWRQTMHTPIRVHQLLYHINRPLPACTLP